jgi:hypothetical protein
MKTRKDYVTLIWIYKERKRIIREKYGFRNPDYVPMMKRLQSKIDDWNKNIKRIDARNEKIKTLVKSVNSFFNCNIHESHFASLPCCVFFKYGIEVIGVEGTKLTTHLRFKNKAIGARQRLNFTKSFKATPRNKEIYHKFKSHIKR